MVQIKGNSGVVLDVSEDIAEALVLSGDVEIVEDPQPKKTAAPRSPKK